MKRTLLLLALLLAAPQAYAQDYLQTFANLEAASSVRAKLNKAITERKKLRLTAAANSGQAVVDLDSQLHAGAWVAVGYGTTSEEIHQISSSSSLEYTLDANLANTHAAGTEVMVFEQRPVYARGLIARTTATTQTTDSAPALQAFLDGVELEDGSAIVMIPPGVYDLETAIDVSEGITLVGGHFVAQGSLSYVFGTSEDNVTIRDMTISGDTHDGINLGPCENFRIENVHMWGGDGSGVKLSNVSRGYVVGCFFESGTLSPWESNSDEWDEGVLIDTGGATDVWIQDCYVEGATVGGLISNNAERVRFENNWIEDITGNGTNTGYGIQVYQTSGSNEDANEHCVIKDNWIEGCDGLGIYIQGSRKCVCTGNYIRDTMRNISLSGSPAFGAIGCIPAPVYADSGVDPGLEQDTLIARNTIIGTTVGPGIVFAGDKVHVINNVIDSPHTYGIQARGARNCMIVGNTFIDCDTDFHHWVPGTLTSGTAQGGAAGTITLAAGASASDDAYNGAEILTIAGTGPGQRRLITDYDGTTKVATVDSNFTVTPDATTTYQVESNRWDDNIVQHAASNRGIEPRVLAGLTVEEGENDYYLEREFTAITDLIGGYIGQEVRFYESYSGVTWYNDDNSANVDSPLTFADGANRSSADGAILHLKKGGLLNRPTKVIHNDNTTLTALTATYDNDSTSSGSTLTFVASEDKLYICFPRPIDACYVTIGSTANALTSAITEVALSSGAGGWNATTLLRDHTQARDITTGLSGITFETDGWIQWRVPEDGSWDDDTYDSTTGRWVRFTFDNDWTASVVIEEIDVRTWGWVEIGHMPDVDT